MNISNNGKLVKDVFSEYKFLLSDSFQGKTSRNLYLELDFNWTVLDNDINSDDLKGKKE